VGENRYGTPGPRPSAYWSMYPQTRLGYEILPYLRELDDHTWSAEEREFLESAEHRKGRPLAEPETRLCVAQARIIGDL
jgi:hypothetical protein